MTAINTNSLRPGALLVLGPTVVAGQALRIKHLATGEETPAA